ncbi:hypothetical protein MKZ38_008162 [Zalerion maritima]|uniref:Methyltransferase n=1 Tax=Zalerion maritima TaxID=339359 RepID=A0AAD5WTZ6_9PEZI|nr:hypothetical protein MKZ38_008162 [Zalerion maritima]
MSIIVNMAEAIPPQETFDDDFEDDFATSEYDGTHMSAFSSVTSSIYAHCYEHGRRYHVYKHGRYPIPNDDKEQGREEMKHVMIKELLDGKLYLSPVDNPQKVMDLGTGTGIWAIEVGDMLPGASVVGTDLSPIQPTWVPPNVNFVIEDMEDNWVHSSDFDFIFMRHCVSLIRNPGQVVDSAFSHLKPKGWVEFQELRPYLMSDDGTLPEDHPVSKFYGLLPMALKEYGFKVDFADDLPRVLERAGFTDVHFTTYKIPLGPWPKSTTLKLVGYYFRTVLLDFVATVMTKPFAEAEISRKECEELLQDVQEAMDNPSIHAYVPLHFVEQYFLDAFIQDTMALADFNQIAEAPLAFEMRHVHFFLERSKRSKNGTRCHGIV